MGARYPLLGITDIDDQHQKLFGCIDILRRYLDTNLGTAVVFETLGKLSRYVEEHFDYEEHLLREKGYVGLAAHIRLHDKLKQDLDDLIQRMLDDEEVTSGLVELLERWLAEHIDVEDRDYAEQLY